MRSRTVHGGLARSYQEWAVRPRSLKSGNVHDFLSAFG